MLFALCFDGPDDLDLEVERDPTPAPTPERVESPTPGTPCAPARLLRRAVADEDFVAGFHGCLSASNRLVEQFTRPETRRDRLQREERERREVYGRAIAGPTWHQVDGAWVTETPKGTARIEQVQWTTGGTGYEWTVSDPTGDTYGESETLERAQADCRVLLARLR